MSIDITLLRNVADVAASSEHQGIEAGQLVPAEGTRDVVALQLFQLGEGAACGRRFAAGDSHVVTQVLEIEGSMTTDQAGPANYENLHRIFAPA
ncbi:hypothetical protein D3C81_1733870 [compost metagenome]